MIHSMDLVSVLGQSRKMTDLEHSFTQSIDRAVALLSLVGEAGVDGARLTDLVAASGLAKPTVRRILLALVRAGLVDQDEETRRYQVGPELYVLGRLASTTVAFSLTAVVSGGGFGLVSSSPDRPGHDKAGSDWGPEQKSGQKIADLGHCRQKRREAHQAAAGTAGLLSFALPHIARRRSAANRARTAAAAKHKLMCRCHPCQERASQWSRPRSSLARSKHSSIVQRSPAAPASSPSETPTGAKAKEEPLWSGSRRLRRIRSQCSKPE